MHNSINTRCAVVVALVLLLCAGQLRPTSGSPQQQKPKGGEGATNPPQDPQQCQPEKVNQLFQEIMKCQKMKRPTTEPGNSSPPPRGPSGTGRPSSPPMAPQFPRRPQYPGSPPSSGPGADGFDFFSRGPIFISNSGPTGQNEGGVLVSRPVPADVQPNQPSEAGAPPDSQFFIAGPRGRTNKNNFPTFGGSGFPFVLSGGGPPRNPPQGGPRSSDGETIEIDVTSNVPQSSNDFPNFASVFGFGAPSGPGTGGGADGRVPNFGFDPSTLGRSPFGNPFGPPTFESAPGGRSSFGFGLPAGGQGPPSFEIDFEELIKILKGLQVPTDNGDNPDSNTTEQPIIDVDTTTASSNTDPTTSSSDETTIMTTPETSTTEATTAASSEKPK